MRAVGKGTFALLFMLAAILACSGQPEPGGAEGSPVTETPRDAGASASVSAHMLPEEFHGLLEPWTGDLSGMVERRLIRVLVVHSGHLFFYEAGEPRGATYETLRAFEAFVNERFGTRHLPIQVVPIPVTRERLLTDVAAGLADIAAANLTITAERRRTVDFSTPFLTGIDEVVVTGPAMPELDTIEDLAGREIFVRASSSYHRSLQRLNDAFRSREQEPVAIRIADELLEDEDILEMVHAGLVPATVVDSHKAAFWSRIHPGLEVHRNLAISTDGEIGWAFRKNSPELAAAVNEFARRHRKGTLFGNVLAERYLGSTDWVERAAAVTDTERLEPLVELFRRYGERYGFDWLMLVAQAYQESGLDPRARSRAGAVGIMQIRPSTARDNNVGIPDVSDLESNIHAGAKYMRFLADRYFGDAALHPLNQWLLAIAAYNAGPARIARVRSRAARNGYDPTVWFGNVEVEAARSVGRETVQYVSNVYRYYVAYKLVWERRQLERELEQGTTAGPPTSSR